MCRPSQATHLIISFPTWIGSREGCLARKQLTESKVDWWLSQAALQGGGAETMMAVGNMLEVVPRGMHKWVGMDVLLGAMGLTAGQVHYSHTSRLSMS